MQILFFLQISTPLESFQRVSYMDYSISAPLPLNNWETDKFPEKQ